MAYSDVNGNNFADSSVRTLSDSLIQAYHDSTNLKTQRDADANITTTIANHEPWIRDIATRLLDLYESFTSTSNQWFSRQNDAKSQSIANDVPNTTEELSGSTSGGRPEINGQDVHRFVTLTMEYVNWFKDATFGGPGTGSPDAMKNTIVICGRETGNIVLTELDVVVLIDNRCVELRNEYQATSGLKLSFVQRTAVNVRMST